MGCGGRMAWIFDISLDPVQEIKYVQPSLSSATSFVRKDYSYDLILSFCKCFLFTPARGGGGGVGPLQGFT